MKFPQTPLSEKAKQTNALAPIAITAADPFSIAGPAVVSFSGGRTSGYMLWRILQSHGGTLPEDVVVCFANTGREMPGTLDFVRDCAAAWNVPVHWLEYRRENGKPTFAEVSHNSASRDGEPFNALLKSRPMLPNPVSRFCSIDLKIRTIKRFLMAEYGWQHWTSIVGLRADEPRRVVKALDHERTKHDRWHNSCPLAEAGIEEYHVLDFFRSRPFNLRLTGRWEGNCDGCFLKNRGAISRMCRDYPDRMAWWAEAEAMTRSKPTSGNGGVFRADREDYATLLRLTNDQGVLPFDLEDSIPCEDAVCGI